MKCEIIRDLLPSYIDGLTSEISNAAIEEHLEECVECRQYVEAMKKEMLSKRYVEMSKEKLQEDIKPFKKIKKETRKRIITTAFTVLFTVAVLGTVFEGLYGSGTQAREEDVKITYEKVDGVVTIGFLPTDDSKYIQVLGGDYTIDEKGNETYEWNKIQPVEWRVKPFENPVRFGDYWSLTFLDKDTILDRNGKMLDLTGDEVLEIEFAEESKKVRIADLYTEEGIKTFE